MNYLKKWWLTLCFTLLTVILMAIIILPHWTTSRQTLTELAYEIMLNISAYTLDKSNSYLSPAEHAAELTRFLADSNLVSSEHPEKMINYFLEQLAIHQQFTGIYYGSTKGEFFMASQDNTHKEKGFYTKAIRIKDGERIITTSITDLSRNVLTHTTLQNDDFDPRKRPWFIDALMSNDVIWTKPYIFFTSKKPGITTASPVYDREGVLQGVVGVDITIDKLSNFLNNLSIGKNGKAFIVDTSGNVVAFPDISALRQTSPKNRIRLSKINELPDPITRKAFSSLDVPPDRLPESPVFTSFTYNGARYNAVFTPFKNSPWPWIIGLYLPEDDYLGSIKSHHKISLISAALAILLSGLIGWIVARKLEAAKKAAISANLAKSQFLAVMSHEIRTPMNVILGTTDLLKESNPREDQKKYIKLLDNAGEGLLSLINDILDMSKVEAGLLDLENIAFNPSRILKQVCRVFELSASKKDLEFSCRINGKLPPSVMGDPVRIKQVLLNLVGNAMKFTETGGVYVQAESRRMPGGKIELKFDVQDTGPGIPKERQKAIFDYFTQADNSISREYQGSGLGLSISKKLCKMMNGDISLTSSPGSGSTFSFSIILSEADNSALAISKKHLKDENKTEACKVLLMEDNKSNQLLFKHFISASPHIMECASNGKEGIEIYKEFQPDIVFMDIEMPVMDGYKATEEIRDWERIIGLPAVPIIALSAHAIKGTAEAAREAGCDSYMTKPITKLQFLERIEQVAPRSQSPSKEDVTENNKNDY